MRQIKYKQPKVILHDNGNVELAEGWIIEYGEYLIAVKCGFISDGNSVPWLFTRIVPKFGRNTLAGIVHDWLYKHDCIIMHSKEEPPVTITRKFADQVRLHFCVKCSVPWYQRTLSYIALRLFGGFAWRSHRRAEK